MILLRHYAMRHDALRYAFHALLILRRAMAARAASARALERARVAARHECRCSRSRRLWSLPVAARYVTQAYHSHELPAAIRHDIR